MWWLCSAALAAPQAIVAGEVFDGERFRGPQTVLIADGLIVDVLPPDAPLPEGAEILDVRADSVSPGLVDAHLQFFSPPLPHIQDMARYGYGKLAELFMSSMVHYRREALSSGVTTVIDLATQRNQMARYRAQLEEGKLLGPRWLPAGPTFTAPGGHPHGTIYRGQHDLEEHAVILLDDTADPGDAREAVDELAAEGVALIKLVYDGGAARGEVLPTLSSALIGVIVERAHHHGLKAVVHVTTAAEALEVVRLGADGLEHGFSIPEDSPLIEEMVRAGVIWTPTVGIFASGGSAAGDDRLAAVTDSVQRAAAAGVPIAAGTGFPSSGGWSVGVDLHREIRLLEAAGLSRTQSLSAATRVAASRVTSTGLGCIAPGCRADLVHWAGDLREGEIHPERIRQVWLDGDALLESQEVSEQYADQLKETDRVIAPYGYYDPVAGVMLGLTMSFFDLFDSGVAADFGGLASLQGRFGASVGVSVPSPISNVSLYANLNYDGIPTSWYGGGNDTAPGDQQNYTPDWIRGSVTTGSQWGSIRLQGQLQGEAVRISGSGPGDGAGGMVGLSPAYDTRDSDTEPWRGGVHIFTGQLGWSDRGMYQLASLDLRRFVSPVDWHTFAARVFVEHASANTPWWRTPEFSSSTIGRGFLPDRFVGPVLVAGQLELRSRIWRGIGIAGFVDVGQVAQDWRSLSASGFHVATGAGLRWRINGQVTLSWDVGFGLEDDGPPGWTLVYHAGHTF